MKKNYSDVVNHPDNSVYRIVHNQSHTVFKCIGKYNPNFHDPNENWEKVLDLKVITEVYQLLIDQQREVITFLVESFRNE